MQALEVKEENIIPEARRCTVGGKGSPITHTYSRTTQMQPKGIQMARGVCPRAVIGMYNVLRVHST